MFFNKRPATTRKLANVQCVKRNCLQTKMEKPTWLDESFVQKVLRNAEKDESIEVSSIMVKPATAKGDNYMSDMHRVTVKFTRIQKGDMITETKSVIAKVTPQGGAWSEMVLKNGFFETEMSMLMVDLPIMNQMIAKFSTTTLAPRCLQVQYENPMYLIIEDLVPRGFRMADRRAGLDLDHCLLAMRNIAVFHAVSVALEEKDPEYMKKYEKNYKREDNVISYPEFVKKSTKILGEEVAKWPELNSRISRKILRLSETIWEKELEVGRFLQNDFNVLNHGDCTLINVMFRYDEQQKPIEQIFVDFQVSRYGTPAMDILTFLGTSPSVDARLDNRDLLLREYHDSLTSNMAKLKCSTKTPSFEDLRGILKKRAFCEVIPSFTALAHALIDRSEVKSHDELMTSDDKLDHPAYRGKMYRKMMTRVLPFFEEQGLLDV